MAEGTMPWQTDSRGDGVDEHFKYQYHPGGDKSKAPKNAPSALNSVIVPNVTLPKVRSICRAIDKASMLKKHQKGHDLFNKYGKEGY